MKQKILKIFYKILGNLAKRYIKRYRPYIIGVTGSVGKTSCRMIIYQILKDYRRYKKFTEDKDDSLLKIYTSPKNFNGEYGLSLSILGIEEYSPTVFGLLKNLFLAFWIAFFGKKKYDIIILEYGIDHPGEMDFLLDIAKPHISITTSVDKVHSQFFPSFDALFKEKAKLALNTREVAFLNYNNPFTRKIYPIVKVDKFLFTVSDYKEEDDVKPDIWFSNYQIKAEKSNIYGEADIWIKSQKFHIKTNLLGKENIGYIGVGIAVLQILANRFDLDIELEENLDLYFRLLPGRFTIFEGIGDSIIIDSSYNAAPESMRKVLENVYNLKKNLFPDRSLIAVLGDMRELGEFTEQKHRQLASLVFNIADELYLVGQSMKEYLIDELEKIGYDITRVKWFPNSVELGQFLKEKLSSDNQKYILVFKGSQNTIFLEEAIKQILKNKEDIKYLPRQNDWWLKKKKIG